MGNCVCSDGFGAAENCTEDNWAAEYAKKLFDAEALARKGADETLQEQITQNKGAIEQEVSDRKTAVSKEAATREAADGDLNKIALLGKDLASAILSANENRVSDVEDLQSQIDALENKDIAHSEDIDYCRTLITEEAEARQRAEDNIDALSKGVGDCSELIIGENETVTDAILWTMSRLEDTRIYSTTPTQIGTWIDGTPIWRWAFVVQLSENDVAWADKTWSPTLPVSNVNSVFITNRWAALYMGSPCIVDDYLLEPELGSGANWIIPSLSNVAFDGIYGWIEFVASADNIVAE